MYFNNSQHKQKGSFVISISIMVLILGLIVIGMYYYFYVKVPEDRSGYAEMPRVIGRVSDLPPPTKLGSVSSNSANEASIWKTYRNEKMGYTFSYSDDFSLAEGMVSSVDGVKLNVTDSVQLSAVDENSETRLLTIYVATKSDSPGFGQPNIFDKNIKTKKILVDGVDALESEEDLGGPFGRKQIGIVNGNKFYVIEAVPDFNDVSREIIKTFKFEN